MRNTQLIFPISNELCAVGAFELHHEERDVPQDQIAKINATIALYSDRQIYARDDSFVYRMEHNDRIMRGHEFLADQTALAQADAH
jgi:hypothetical protein